MTSGMTRRALVKAGAAVTLGTAATYAKPSLRVFGVPGALAYVSGEPGNPDDDIPDIPANATIVTTSVIISGQIVGLPSGTYPAPVWFAFTTDGSASGYRIVRFTAADGSSGGAAALAGVTTPEAGESGFLLQFPGVFTVTLEDNAGQILATSSVTVT